MVLVRIESISFWRKSLVITEIIKMSIIEYILKTILALKRNEIIINSDRSMRLWEEV